MAKRKHVLRFISGILLGVLTSHLFTSRSPATYDMCVSMEKKHIVPAQLINEEDARASNKNLLFVGIMTAAKYLDTRAKAVYETWGRQVPGKVMFYSSEISYSEHVPLVPLSAVDDSYPPQKKSFMMLKHMHDNYIDQYEWFLRADDDVFIRTDKLETLLRSVDSKRAWFIGQTGRGNTEEFGLLSLENDENFCMGGPGVILSRETLRRIAPYIEDCLEHLYTTHEDVELGRCVRRFAGISCTWSYEMQVIFYHNKSGEAAFAGELKQKEVHRAITLHPVKQPEYMYRLHKYVKGLKIQSNLQESIMLHRDIAMSMKELGYHTDRLDVTDLVKDLPLFPSQRGTETYLGDTNVLGTPTSINRYTAHTLDDVLEWELIAKSLYSHKDLNPRKRIGSSLKEGLNDVVREVMELINSFSKQRGRVIDFKEILYGYWRVNPVHGVDLILDLLLVYKKYRGNKMTVQVRRHAYLQQTFAGIFMKEVENYDSSVKTAQEAVGTESLTAPRKIVEQIFSELSKNLQPVLNLQGSAGKPLLNFLLPLSGRYDIFKRFLRIYENVCLKEEDNTRLVVILYKNEAQPRDFEETMALIKDMKGRYPRGDLQTIHSNETFARGKALQLGVNSLNDNDLMLFIDVDIVFNKKSLQRIRQNTIRNRLIYFPVVYSLYNPGLSNRSLANADYLQSASSDLIDERDGFWRQFGFGIVSLYKSDFLNLGGFDLMISGWGYEDVTFYDNVVKSDMKIFRCVDPGLIHVYHRVTCDDSLDAEQKSMCIGTKASTLGSVCQLQRIFYKYKLFTR